MKDLLKLFGGIQSGMYLPPRTIGRDEVEGLIISTVDSYDLGPETAILDANGSHPVERYGSVAAAEKGHIKWVAWAGDRKNKKATKLGYLSLVDEKRITLKRRR